MSVIVPYQVVYGDLVYEDELWRFGVTLVDTSAVRPQAPVSIYGQACLQINLIHLRCRSAVRNAGIPQGWRFAMFLDPGSSTGNAEWPMSLKVPRQIWQDFGDFQVKGKVFATH